MGNEGSIEGGEGLGGHAEGDGRGFAQIPAGMEADLSRLSEEERKQIAAVMSRAQELPTDRSAIRNPTNDPSQSPRHPSKPPDPGPTGLSKSRTVDAFKTETKPPGRSPSAMSLREPKSKPDIKEDQKTGIMSGFLTESNPMNMVSSVVNKFNPFEAKSDSKEDLLKQQIENVQENKEDPKSINRASPQMQPKQEHAKAPIPTQQHPKSTQQQSEIKPASLQQSPARTSTQPSIATKALPHTPIPKEPLPGSANSTKPLVQEPKHTTSLPHGQDSKKEPMKQDISVKPIPSTMDKQSFPPTGSSMPPKTSEREKLSTQPPTAAKQPFQEQPSSKMPQSQQPGTAKAPLQQSSPIKQPIQQSSPSKTQGPPQQGIPTAGTKQLAQKPETTPLGGTKQPVPVPVKSVPASKPQPLKDQRTESIKIQQDTSQKVSKAATKNMCPLCKTTELMLDENKKPNYNTCTQCKITVCSLCGFNPNPHITEMQEWLCLNCQMQRALGMDMAGPPMPQPGKQKPAAPSTGVSASSPKKEPNVVPEKLHKQVLKTSPMVPNQFSAPDSPSKFNQPTTESRTGKPTISEKSKPIVPEKKQPVEPAQTVSSQHPQTKPDSALSSTITAETKITESIKTVFEQSAKELKQFALPGQQQRTAQEVETSHLKEDYSKSPKKMFAANQLAQKEVPLPISPKPSPLDKPVAQQASQSPELSSSKPSLFQKPVTSQPSVPGSPKSNPTHKPASSQSAHLSGPGSPKSSPAQKPVAPQSTQPSGPGSPKSSPAHKPVAPQSTQPSGPGSPKPSPAHKPVAPQTTQPSGPGSPKPSPAHKPVAIQSTQPSGPGSPKSSPPHKPAVPQSTQFSGPGSPKPSPAHKPIVPQSTQLSGPGSPKSSPAHKPVAPQSQPFEPGSPKSGPFHKPVAPQTPQAPQPSVTVSPKSSPLHKPSAPQTTQSSGPGSPKPSPPHKPLAQPPSAPGSPKPSPPQKPVAQPPSAPGSPKPSPPQKPVISQTTSQPIASTKPSPLPKPGTPQVAAQPTAQPPKSQEQGRRFSLNLGSATEAPKIQPTTPQETVTGKLFGFGASIFSQASSFISTSAQPGAQTQSTQGTTPKQPAPAQKIADNQKPIKEPTVPHSPKLPVINKETQPVPSKISEEPKSSPLKKAVDDKKISEKETKRDIPEVNKTAKTEPEIIEKIKETKTLCPLCKTELNIGSKDIPNFNTCTECKKMVCNFCGFNPTPHLTEAAEWLCLNCQTQRALSGHLGDLDKMPQPLGLSPKSSPKHHIPADQPQKPLTGSTPNVKLNDKITDQVLKKEMTRHPEGKLGQIDNVLNQESKDIKPIDIKPLVTKEDPVLVTPVIAEVLPIKEHKQDTIKDTAVEGAEHLQSEGKMMPKKDLMIDLSATALKELDGETCDERIKPEASQLMDHETGKEKTEKEDDKSDTSNSQQQKSPQGLSDTGYSSDGISGSLGEIPSLIPSDEKDLFKEPTKKDSLSHEYSPSSPSDLAKLESTVLSILEAQTSVLADEMLRKGNDLYGKYAGQTHERSRTKILPITPESYSSEEELEDIQEEEDETLENGKKGLQSRKLQKEGISKMKDITVRKRQDSIDDSSESENSPVPQRKRRTSNGSSSSDDFKHEDSQGSGDDEDFIRKQIIEMSADEDASGSEDEEFIRTKLKEISANESQKRETKTKPIQTKCKRLTKKSSASYDDDGIRRHSWHDDDEEDEDEETFVESPEPKFRETKSQENEELSLSAGGGLRRFKTIELNSTMSNTYTEETSKPPTKLYYDEEPELEMESLTDSPEDRSREERSSSLHASSFTPGTSPTSVSSLDEDSDSSPSHKKMSGETKQQRKARHRSHGPVLPTIEDSSEEEELREEEELLKEQEKQRELEQQQQQRKSSSKKSKKDKDELRAQRRRERPKTPPSNLSPIEDASPTEELRQAAEMEELHRSSCSEYSPSIESEPEGFEISPEKILEVQKVYKLPTSVSLYSPTEVTSNVVLTENTNGQQTLKSAEEAYEDILCKAKLYHSDKEKEDVFEKEPLYGGMLIEDYIYESLVEENYDESLDVNIIGSQHHIFEQRLQDVKNNSAGDINTNTAQTIASVDSHCFKTETFHSMLPHEDIVSSSYIVPESHEIIILENTDDRQCHEDASGFYEIIASQDMQLTPGSSPTQHKNEFNMKPEPTSSMNVDIYKTEDMILTASVESSSLNSMSIPDVKITQHFTAEEPEDDVVVDYNVEKASDYSVSKNTEVSTDGKFSTNASCNADGALVSSYFISQTDTQHSQTSTPSSANDIYTTNHVIISLPDIAQATSAQSEQISSAVSSMVTESTGNVPLEDKTKEHPKDASNAVTAFLINHVQPMTTVCIVSTKHTVTSTANTHATTATPNLESVISSAPSVTSKVMPFIKRSSDSTDPVSTQISVPPRPPPPPPPPLPPAATPKPALSSKKRPAPKIPTAKAKPSAVGYNNEGVQQGSPLKTSSTPITRPHAPPPPVPPKPSSIPAGLIFSHKTIESSKPQKVPKPVTYDSPVAMQKRTEAQHKTQAHSIPSSMTLNLVSSTEYQLPSPTSPLSPHSNKSSPRLSKLSQETYVVITLPSEPGTPTENDPIYTTTCWPLETTVHDQVPQITQTVFSTTPLSISKKVSVSQPSDILNRLSQITVEDTKATVSLPQSTVSEFTCIPDVFPTGRTVTAQSQLKLVGKSTESNDIIDLRTLNKIDYKVNDFEVDSCMDLSSTTEVKRQSSAFSSMNRPISAVQPAIVNLSTPAPVVSSMLLVSESITVMTSSTTVSYASSLESLVDLGNSMTEPLKLTTSKQYEEEHVTYPVDVEVPINLSLGVPAHLIAGSTTKPFQVTSGSVTNGSTDISTSQESVDSGVVDLSTTKFLRTMVTVDDAASAVVTEIIEDDKPVDLTAGRRAVCCDVVYKLPFGRSCISQQPSTTLPEDRFGYRDDHYQYDRSGISGFRGIGGMKPSMSDTNLAEAGLFLYKSKNTFDYPVGIADGIAVDLTSGKMTTGEALDYQTKTTGSYPETRQVISGLGISAPQYSQARMTASIVPPYGMGSVLRSSNGVVYSSVTSPIPSTFAITTQPGSIFSTTGKDLSTFITTDTVTSLSSLNQAQPLPRTYSMLTSSVEDETDVMSVIDTSLQTFPVDVVASTQGDLVSILTSESDTFSEMTEDESSFIIPADDGKQQHLHLQRELLELEKLKQQRLAEELEWERQEIQRFREQETFMVQKKLEELQSMKQHLLYQQEEERQAQFMMRQETLAQQQLHLEQIQQLQQQLHQQLEEQKIRQMYQYGYDSENVPPQTSSEQVIIEGQYSASEEGQFWTGDQIATTSSAVAGVDMAPSEAWYAVQSDGVPQYISRPGILNSVSELSLKDMDINDERQLKKRSSMPRLCGMYDELDGSMQDDPRSYKLIVDSGVQTDDEDGNDNRFTGRRRRSKKGVDTSVQTDDEDQDEWDIPTRSRRRSRAGKYSEVSNDAEKSRPFSKVSNMAVQTVAEISVQTEPLGTIRTPSIRAKVDSKVEIIKHISAPEKSYKGESLGCQTETDSDLQSPPYLNDLSQKDKRRPTPLEIGYSSHLRAESSLQVAPSPPKSPKVLYSPISPVSPSKALESAFVPYDKTMVDDIGTHKPHADIVQIPPPSPKSPKVMQRSMSDPKPLSPTAEDIARTQFQYSDGYSTKTMQSGTQKKVKRTLPNPPPEEAVSGLQSTYSTVGSVSRRRICRNTTMARAKILQDIDRELDLVERESSKLRKKQAELDEEEKEIDAKLRYLEMGINRRKEALLKEREKRERAYLQGVAEERDYMSDSEVSNTRPTRIENHLGLDRPQTVAQTEYTPYLPPQTQTETQFAPQTSPYTQYQYQTPTLLTQAPTQFPQQSIYQQPLYHQQVSSFQTQPTFQAVPTMSYTPQPQSTQSQQSSYQHTSQLLLLQQKARQSALDLDSKITSHYDVLRNQPLIIAPVSTDSSYSVSHLGSKYSTLDLRLGLDEKSSIASSPMSSISADSFYADLEHHASRNYVLIDDIGELTKSSGSMSSAFGLHEKELSKTDRLLRTVECRRTPEVTDFLSPISTSTRLHTYGKDEDSMEDPYELKLLKHQIKQEFRRGTETLDPLSGYSPYYHSDSLYRHFPKSEKYSISRLTLEKQAAKQLPPAILYQKQPKHKKSLIDRKISKFSPIQESRDLEPDYSTYLSSSTSSIPSISSKVRLLQDDITYGLRKNITDQQKFLGPALAQSLGSTLNTNLRTAIQDEVDKPYVSGNRSRPSSRPSSVYGLDLSIKRDLSSSSLRQKAESEALETTFSHAAPSGRTKPSSLPISQSRGRIPIVAQNSEEESPLSPVGQPMGMARAAAGPLPPISADTRDQFGSSHSLPEVQQHMREESRTRGYDRDIAFIMDDFHAMSDSEDNSFNDAYHLRREETDWFDKPRESRLENGHGIERKLPDKLSHTRPAHPQEQMNGKPIHYPFPHTRIKLLRDPKDHTVSGNGFGMRIIGGKEIPGSQGETGAYIAKVFPGGSAEQTGRLTEGMLILEWNGFQLTAKTYEEVQSIISQSSGEADICVRLDISMLSNSATPQNLELHDPGKAVEKTKSPGVDPKQLAAELQKVSQQQTPSVVSSAMEKGSYIHSGTTSAASSAVPSPGQPGSPSVSKKRHSSKSTEAVKAPSHPITGEIQLQVNYDKHLGNLIIHILQARNLVPRDNNGYSDPFVKVYLLPGRGQVMVVQNASAEYKRRTKYVQKSLNPEWNQTVIYKSISMEQLKKKTLEVTVWDYDRFSSNDFLGEVLIDLSNASYLDNMPRWYPLKEQSESIDHAKSHASHSSQQVPKPSVIKSRSHGIFPDPSKDMQVPTIEKSHSSPGSSKSSSEGHLRSHGPSRSQSKSSVTQTHLEDAGAAIAAAEAAVQQLRLQPTAHKSVQSNYARKQHRHTIAGVLPIQRTQSDNLPSPANDSKDQSQLALKKTMSDGSVKAEARPATHRTTESTVSTTSSVSSFGSGYSMDSDSNTTQGDNNLFQVPRIGKMNQNGQDQTGLGLTETEGKTQVMGEIKIALKKEMKTDGEQLIVEILQCRNITYKFKSPDHLPDLYVKLYVINIATQKRIIKKKTRVCRHDREPSFNETFRFSMSPAGHSLQILLASNGGKFMKKTLIGEAYIWLDKVDLRKRIVNWHKLLASSTQTH
ncbi:protein piccolo isoform 2-T2 [Anomaloglossus baeobatrachus]|uniref:protein piccolo isoform X2 n=1 Tax=Anomaloglossus baeobatrachus TaxID=238106 RepID=UPI003F4FB713